MFVTADCHPDGEWSEATAQRDAWLAHLRRSYSPRRAVALLDAWAHEDVYQPLDVEIDLLTRSGFDVDVVWRWKGFAVVRGRRS